MAPALVQYAYKAVSGSSLTVTLGTDNPGGPSPGATTAGNTLVALIGTSANTTNGTVSGITLGGSADNWAAKASEGTGPDHAISAGWADPDCAGGQTAVAITLTGGSGDNLFAWVFEWSSLSGTLDVSSGASTVGGFISSWTSGTTAATAQASEVAFGITCGAASSSPGGSAGLTGPSSPWVNLAQQALSGSSHEKDALVGYQILSSTGTVTYNGTSSPTNTNDTLVFTLKAAAAVSPSGLLIASII